MCTRPAFAWLCSMVAKRGEQITPNCSSSTAMIVPWSVGSVASKTDEILSASLLQKLGVKDVTSILRYRQLRWYGHVQRAMSCMKFISQTFRFPAVERKEGLRRHGLNVWRLMSMLNGCGLAGVDPLDRDAWRASVRHSLVLPTPYNGTWTAP